MQYRELTGEAFLWTLQGLCALHRKPFSIELANQQLAPPYTIQSLISAVGEYGFDAALRKTKSTKLHAESFPLIVWLQPTANDNSEDGKTESTQVETPAAPPRVTPALILQADGANVLIVESSSPAPVTLPLEQWML